MPSSLYMHVPFCPRICPYCDFHKMRRNEALVTSYLERIEREAEDLHEEFPGSGPLRTAYLGGGTPSHLTDAELWRLIRALGRTWGFPAAEETTLEADPLTFDASRLKAFRDMGFSRLSIGLQSTQDEVLRFLGRAHSGAEGLGAVDMALEGGFEVSADLITAVPSQDTAADLEALAATGIPHISVYSLTVEANTPFGRRGVKVDPEKDADDYQLTQEILAAHGLERYEVSSHARPGHESRHNQVYWRGDWFLGLGPSAASFVPVQAGSSAAAKLLGERRTNPPIKTWLLGQPPEVLPVDAATYAFDLLMTGLRTRAGVDMPRALQRSGVDIAERYRDVLARFERLGWLERSHTHLRATPEGLLRLDGILEAFFRQGAPEPRA